jgi:hypothetical protein
MSPHPLKIAGNRSQNHLQQIRLTDLRVGDVLNFVDSMMGVDTKIGVEPHSLEFWDCTAILCVPSQQLQLFGSPPQIDSEFINVSRFRVDTSCSRRLTRLLAVWKWKLPSYAWSATFGLTVLEIGLDISVQNVGDAR